MTAPRPAEPRFVQWGACERCGAAGLASELDDRYCVTCLPPLEEQRVRADRVAKRVRLARHAATREDGPVEDTPIPPDVEHIWLMVGALPVPHLFLDDETSAYCGRAWLGGRRARADLDTPAPEDATACKQCWRVYRAGRRGA